MFAGFAWFSVTRDERQLASRKPILDPKVRYKSLESSPSTLRFRAMLYSHPSSVHMQEHRERKERRMLTADMEADK